MQLDEWNREIDVGLDRVDSLMDRTSVRDINGRQIKRSGFVFETCHGGTGGVITGRVEIVMVVM